MASLGDLLARLAPRDIGEISLEWTLDTGGTWFEVTAWASPGVKLGELRHDVPFRHTVRKTGDARADVSLGVDTILTELRERTKPPIPVKRKPGRPRKTA